MDDHRRSLRVGLLGTSSRRLWLVLSLFVLAGMAFTVLFAWAVGVLYSGADLLLASVTTAGSAAGIVVCLLFTMGLVYRADRRRHDILRRIRLFE